MKYFQTIEVPVTTPGQWGKTRPAIIAIPPTKEFTLPDGTWPIIDYCHGVGVQAGANGRNVDLFLGEPSLISAVEKYGIPSALLNGKRVEFIVLAVQAEFFSPEPEWKPFVFDFLKAQGIKYSPNYVGVAGVSAGGSKALEHLLKPITAKIYAAGAPMSLQGYTDALFSNLLDNSIETWYFCGPTEGTYTDVTKKAQALQEAVYKGSTRLSIMKDNTGHGPWEAAFMGQYGDLWQFFLDHPKDGKIPVPVPDPVPPVKVKKEVAVLYDDHSFEWKGDFNGDFAGASPKVRVTANGLQLVNSPGKGEQVGKLMKEISEVVGFYREAALMGTGKDMPNEMDSGQLKKFRDADAELEKILS